MLNKHLRLVLEPSKGAGVYDPVAVALKTGPKGAFLLRNPPPSGVLRVGRICGRHTDCPCRLTLAFLYCRLQVNETATRRPIMQLPPKVTDRAFDRLAEIGAADSGKALRIAVEGNDENLIPQLEGGIQSVLDDAMVEVKLHQKQKMLLMGTKESHCIGDLLIRCYEGDLDVEIVGLVSNHDSLRPLAEKFDVSYVHVPTQGLSREEHEDKVLEELKNFDFDWVILAKYMRILTPKIIKSLDGKLINIHHSFLPAFIGANPYKQAHERGVKIVGATAHFVTDELDEGPIIAQNVIPVHHAMCAQELRRRGKDVEKVTLAHAIDLVVDGRVFISGNKTIVF